MVVFFSAAFLGVFVEILGHIEGFARPLELVSADFLRHCVETELSKFFRVTRSQTSKYDTTMLMSTPQLCAANLTNFVNKLVKDLSDDVERARSEEYYLLNLRIEASSSSKSTSRPNTRYGSELATSSSVTIPPAAENLICGSHLGAMLKAVHLKTKTIFVCKAGENCKFDHVNIEGKSKKDILGLIATLPPIMRASLITAAKRRV